VAVGALGVSKGNTTAQSVRIAFVLGERIGVTDFQLLIGPTVLAVAALTVASAGAYLVEWVRHMAGTGEASGGSGVDVTGVSPNARMRAWTAGRFTTGWISLFNFSISVI